GYEYLSLRGEPEHRGMIRGFVSPERTRLYETQLRAMRDFVDPTAGLCLAIEMLKSYSHSRLRANDVILLPLSSQEYRLNFHEPSREWLTGAVG
ncbi:MAG TPA: hypothetical protein VFH39_01350, partial [Candidatus Saccharimonadales bacterium]|nr:hypothetical protein [Candidatus Saccharimonadales bacterium]